MQITAPYRVKITVLATKVSGTQTGFPVYVDLSDMPSGFFSHVVSGADIRVTTSDRETEVPYELVALNTGAQTGQLWFKGDISSSANTDFYIYYGSPGISAYAAGDTYGSQAVWSGYTNIYHLDGDADDSTSTENNGAAFGESVTFVGDAASFAGEELIGGTVSGSSTIAFGQSTQNQRIAQSFVASDDATARLETLFRRVANGGSPSNTVSVSIQGDSAGSPDGVSIASTTISSTAWGLVSTNADSMAAGFNVVSANLVAGTTYWFVITVSSSLSDTNYRNMVYDPAGVVGVLKQYNGASWNVVTGSLRLGVYRSGYIKFDSSISIPIQDLAFSCTIQKTDSNYECIVANSPLDTDGHLEINGSSSSSGSNTGTPGDVNYRPNSGSQQTVSLASVLNTSDGLEHRINYVRDTVSARWYVDGALAATDITSATGTNDFNYLGVIQNRLNATYSKAFKGLMREVYFAPASVYTSDYIFTEYNNQSSPSTFYSVSAEESFSGPGLPIIMGKQAVDTPRLSAAGFVPNLSVGATIKPKVWL